MDIENLRPIEKFVEEHMKDVTWREDKEFLLYNSPNQRFKITVESAKMSLNSGFIDLWRDEKLMEANIYPACEDAKEFAKGLIDTMFYYLSPHEMQHVIDALQKDLDRWKNNTGRDISEHICSYCNCTNESL